MNSLSGLYQSLESRTKVYPKLSKLHGRLDLLLTHVSFIHSFSFLNLFVYLFIFRCVYSFMYLNYDCNRNTPARHQKNKFFVAFPPLLRVRLDMNLNRINVHLKAKLTIRYIVLFTSEMDGWSSNFFCYGVVASNFQQLQWNFYC